MTAAPIPVEWRLSALAKLNTCLKPQQQYMQLSAVLAMPAEERVENLITKMTEDRTVNSLTSSHPPSANGGNTLVRAFPPPSHLLEGTCSRRETGHTPERRRLFLPSLFRRWGFCLCFFPPALWCYHSRFCALRLLVIESPFLRLVSLSQRGGTPWVPFGFGSDTLELVSGVTCALLNSSYVSDVSSNARKGSQFGLRIRSSSTKLKTFVVNKPESMDPYRDSSAL